MKGGKFLFDFIKKEIKKSKRKRQLRNPTTRKGRTKMINASFWRRSPVATRKAVWPKRRSISRSRSRSRSRSKSRSKSHARSKCLRRPYRKKSRSRNNSKKRRRATSARRRGVRILKK